MSSAHPDRPRGRLARSKTGGPNIEDALRTFAADKILVVAHPDDQAGWLEERTGATAQARFSLPITRVTVAEDGSLARPGS
jgi:hypothetical protein